MGEVFVETASLIELVEKEAAQERGKWVIEEADLIALYHPFTGLIQ